MLEGFITKINNDSTNSFAWPGSRLSLLSDGHIVSFLFLAKRVSLNTEQIQSKRRLPFSGNQHLAESVVGWSVPF